MVLRAEARLARRLHDRGLYRALQCPAGREVLDPPAVRADEVMVVTGEILRELVARELVVRHDAVHDAGVFEHDEVAVHRALRELGAPGQDLGDREGSIRGREHVEQLYARRCHALLLTGEPLPRRFLQLAASRHDRRGYRRPAIRCAPMNATERFVALVSAEEQLVRLDVGAFCIAAHAHPDLDIDAGCARLDDLAAGCASPTFAAVRAHLFGAMGFRGNDEDYGDPENSFLDSVLDRRVGLPITLAVLVIEVARRLGVAVEGVGMPGHFLVRDVATDGVWCDPFAGGALLDLDGCRRRFDAVFLGAREFDPSFLVGTSPRAILARLLANLEQGRLANDPAQLVWMCELHTAIPGLSAAEHRMLTARLRRLRARWN